MILCYQATVAPPVKGKMFKGLCVCYAVVAVTFFSVAISGYWAFGNQAEGLVLTNFLDNGKPLVPKWFILMTNGFTILQLSAVGVVRVHPYISVSVSVALPFWIPVLSNIVWCRCTCSPQTKCLRVHWRTQEARSSLPAMWSPDWSPGHYLSS